MDWRRARAGTEMLLKSFGPSEGEDGSLGGWTTGERVERSRHTRVCWQVRLAGLVDGLNN